MGGGEELQRDSMHRLRPGFGCERRDLCVGSNRRNHVSSYARIERKPGAGLLFRDPVDAAPHGARPELWAALDALEKDRHLLSFFVFGGAVAVLHERHAFFGVAALERLEDLGDHAHFARRRVCEREVARGIDDAHV